jgi:hypothetical protein
MHQSYRDIREKLGEPVWWDEYGVPRYCSFEPSRAGDVYADEVALLEIACQSCGRLFQVAITESKWHMMLLEAAAPDRDIPTLAEAITGGSVHYGDPPNVGCCMAGATMNCQDLRVLEYWWKEYNNHLREWTRRPELEIWLPDSQRAGEWRGRWAPRAVAGSAGSRRFG